MGWPLGRDPRGWGAQEGQGVEARGSLCAGSMTLGTRAQGRSEPKGRCKGRKGAQYAQGRDYFQVEGMGVACCGGVELQYRGCTEPPRCTSVDYEFARQARRQQLHP